MNFHGLEVQQQCTNIAPSGMDGDAIKVKMFLASKKAVNRQDNTLKQYTREIYKMLNFLGKRLENITGMDLCYYYGVMREKIWYQNVYDADMAVLSIVILGFLITEELVHNNPVKKVGLLKLQKTIKKPFSAAEMEALCVNCIMLRDRALVEFLYSTSVRVSELVSLNVSDIEMGKQELIVYGKGSKERKTYLTDSAKFYLKRYLKERQEKKLAKTPLFVTLDKPHERLAVAGVPFSEKGEELIFVSSLFNPLMLRCCQSAYPIP